MKIVDRIDVLIRAAAITYPFSYEVEGRRVRGARAYDAETKDAQARFGEHTYWLHAWRLTLWHATCHVLCSLLFVLVLNSIILSYGRTAVLVASTAFLLFFAWTEFWHHPKKFGQIMFKSITDFLEWSVPVLFYLAFLFIW